MLNERTLWRAAVTVAIGLLLVMIFLPRWERRERTTPQFDEPAPRPAIWRTVRVVQMATAN